MIKICYLLIIIGFSDIASPFLMIGKDNTLVDTFSLFSVNLQNDNIKKNTGMWIFSKINIFFMAFLYQI